MPSKHSLNFLILSNMSLISFIVSIFFLQCILVDFFKLIPIQINYSWLILSSAVFILLFNPFDNLSTSIAVFLTFRMSISFSFCKPNFSYIYNLYFMSSSFSIFWLYTLYVMVSSFKGIRFQLNFLLCFITPNHGGFCPIFYNFRLLVNL